MARSRVNRAKALRTLPPIPCVLQSALGPITVERVKELRDVNGKSLLGQWLADTRTIKLERDCALVTAWHTLWHEWVHATLWDAGGRLPSAAEEQAADALASARVYAMLHHGTEWAK